MSQSDNDGYNGLKAFAFTVGVTVLIFLILYAAKRYNPSLFAQQSFGTRSYSWYFRTTEDPAGPNPDGRRRSLGEKPRIWDVWIASWYPRSRPAGPGQDEDASRAVDGEKNAEWGGFLPLSVDKILDANAVLPQAKPSDPAQSTPSAQVQIGTIILMPAPLDPASRPSTSSPNLNTCDPPREYVLGTSHLPYTTGD